MSKNTLLKLNKYIAILVLTFMFLGASASSARAAIFDSPFKSDDQALTNSTFSFITSYLSFNNQKSSDGNLLLIQNSSLASTGSPFLAKKEYPVPANKETIVREMAVSASAYSSTPDQTDDSPFITAWNTHVRDGIVAANFLPFGTKIKIPDIYGDKIFVVEDRMNRRYRHKVDIWFPDRQSALEFGIKTIKIQILES